MKKKMAIVVLAMVLAGLMAGNCFAAAEWFNCPIYRLQVHGPAAGSAQLSGANDLNTVTFPSTWIRLDPGNLNRLIAVGLTALSNGTKCSDFLGSRCRSLSRQYTIMYALNH